MGVLLPILVSMTQQPLREHPLASQLSSGPLCFMTEKITLIYHFCRYWCR